MSRYRGPKHKLSRRLGKCIWGNPNSPANKRPFASGQHGQNQRRKLSVYGQQLLEKQKIRMHYGAISERQFRRIFEHARRMGGNTGTNFLMLLESRLDAIIWRMGFAPTIFAARQLVSHGHVEVDGKRVDIPSFRVEPGMLVGIRERSRQVPMIVEGAENPPFRLPEYIDRPRNSFEGRMTALPNAETIPFQADLLQVIGYYSR